MRNVRTGPTQFRRRFGRWAQFSPHPGPLPMGEGESLPACLAIETNGRVASRITCPPVLWGKGLVRGKPRPLFAAVQEVEIRTLRTILIASMVFGLVCRAPAQVFNCGSTGALGDVVITTNPEWAMPDNGQFHLNSLIVTNNATLTFLKPTSGLNPPVYLLSRGNVVISGRISVDGQPGQLGGAVSPGGPGGFAGGSSGYIFGNPTNGGDGYGPGRGRFLFANGPGSFGTSNISSSAAGPTYGSLPLLPLIGGSGGAGCSSSPGSS